MFKPVVYRRSKPSLFPQVIEHGYVAAAGFVVGAAPEPAAVIL